MNVCPFGPTSISRIGTPASIVFRREWRRLRLTLKPSAREVGHVQASVLPQVSPSKRRILVLSGCQRSSNSLGCRSWGGRIRTLVGGIRNHYLGQLGDSPIFKHETSILQTFCRHEPPIYGSGGDRTLTGRLRISCSTLELRTRLETPCLVGPARIELALGRLKGGSFTA